VCCSVLQCVAVCCSVLQCVAVCAIVTSHVAHMHVSLRMRPRHIRLAAHIETQTATHCNTLQQTATNCNKLQHTVTLCHTLQSTSDWHLCAQQARYGVLYCVTVRRSALPCVAVWYSVLQVWQAHLCCLTGVSARCYVCCGVCDRLTCALQPALLRATMLLQSVAVCCSVLQCAAVCCSVLQCVWRAHLCLPTGVPARYNIVAGQRRGIPLI